MATRTATPAGTRKKAATTAATQPAAPAGIAHADFIAGMAKGLAVLESFDTERQRLNATLAAERAGLTRAAARRHLLTLAYLGYLESDGQYFWLAPRCCGWLGGQLSRLGAAAARGAAHAEPAGRADAAAFSAAVLEGREVVIVPERRHAAGRRRARHGPLQQRPGRAADRVLAYGLHLGSRLPAHATSTGRMLLATRTRSAVRDWLRGHPLPRLTAYTRTDAPALRAPPSTRPEWRIAASPAKSTSWAFWPWPCRCATCRATPWRAQRGHRAGPALARASQARSAAAAAGCGAGAAAHAVRGAAEELRATRNPRRSGSGEAHHRRQPQQRYGTMGPRRQKGS